jgi:hypothetical protein
MECAADRVRSAAALRRFKSTDFFRLPTPLQKPSTLDYQLSTLLHCFLRPANINSAQRGTHQKCRADFSSAIVRRNYAKRISKISAHPLSNPRHNNFTRANNFARPGNCCGLSTRAKSARKISRPRRQRSRQSNLEKNFKASPSMFPAIQLGSKAIIISGTENLFPADMNSSSLTPKRSQKSRPLITKNLPLFFLPPPEQNIPP